MNFKDRIAVKLKDMRKYVVELEEMLPDELLGYKKNLTERRACEKTIELALETVIDIVSMIVAYEKVGVPSSEDELIGLFSKTAMFSPALLSSLKAMKGFRNILVHRYGEVDDEKVYHFLTEELDDFVKFEKEVVVYLKQKKGVK